MSSDEIEQAESDSGRTWVDWDPENSGKIVARELKKMRDKRAAAALLGLVKKWEEGSSETDAAMFKAKQMKPCTTHGHDLFYFRVQVGSPEFRLVFEQLNETAHGLHAFKKTAPEDSRLGFDTAEGRQKTLDKRRSDRDKQGKKGN